MDSLIYIVDLHVQGTIMIGIKRQKNKNMYTNGIQGKKIVFFKRSLDKRLRKGTGETASDWQVREALLPG